MMDALPTSEIARLDLLFPARPVALAGGAEIVVRECGAGGVQGRQGARKPVVVCLHGIGSGSGSWFEVAQRLGRQARVIAWDTPGYGASTPLPMTAPKASDYAERLGALLDALQIERCVLVGHSLGALIAGAAARADSPLALRIAQLVLISPARGYGAAKDAELRQRVRTGRLDSLARLGVAGMAIEAPARMLSELADTRARQWVQWNMARLNESGWVQAVELLCGADLLADLPPASTMPPARVACGALDTVTPPAACAEVAARCGVVLESIADAGHACYVEQPQAVADWLAGIAISAADTPSVRHQ
ncbi:MAG: alpha/beta hydrolase [Variovorax sp.]